MSEVREVIKQIDQHIMSHEYDIAEQLCLSYQDKFRDDPDFMCTESIIAYKKNNILICSIVGNHDLARNRLGEEKLFVSPLSVLYNFDVIHLCILDDYIIIYNKIFIL